jgi:hypothetical protein
LSAAGGGLPAEDFDRLLKVEALFTAEAERLSKLKGLLGASVFVLFYQ